MAHLGIICPPGVSHLNSMTAFGYELKQRGHQVTLVGVYEAQAQTEAAGLQFWPIGQTEFPLGSTSQALEKLGQLSGVAAVRYTFQLIRNGAAMVLREAPAAIRQAGIDALLVDQASPEGGTVADYLGLPFISVCNALLLNREPKVPPPFTDWGYNPAWWAQLRNQATYTAISLIAQPIRQVLEDYRREWKLPPFRSPNDAFSKLAQISQSPPEFEFPREALANCVHFTGPFHNPVTRSPVPFPYDRLTGQPLIYASLGTIQNRAIPIFEKIAEACVGLDAQLVISLGGGADIDALPPLAGQPLVVRYAPQLELLKRTALMITHAGMNTAMECLNQGVPMVAIPITNDQPGVAARIAWTGAGEFVPVSGLSVPRLRSAIQQVLTEPTYRQNALRLQAAIQRSGGAKRAADIVEQVVITGKPVYSSSE